MIVEGWGSVYPVYHTYLNPFADENDFVSFVGHSRDAFNTYAVFTTYEDALAYESVKLHPHDIPFVAQTHCLVSCYPLSA